MQFTVLLPHLANVRLIQVALQPDELILEVAVRAVSARCPSCRHRSRRVHSTYIRHIADQPIGGRRVTIHWHVRRFRCPAATCARRTFVEQRPHLAARYARRSQPLQALLEDVGLTLGGRRGARFAGRRGVRISRMSLLRLVRRLPLPPAGAPAVLGIDDFALRRGHRYGTVLVDLQGRRIVDVLPDRTRETVEGWMAQRAAPEFVCRDRGGAYAEAAHHAAPTATQISDRFHLACNANTVLERVLARHAAALRAATAEEGVTAGPAAPPPEAQGAEPPPDLRRAHRQARYDAVRALHDQGWSITAISAHMGLCRQTVRTYVRADACPTYALRRTLLRAGARHTAYLQARWEEGCRDAKALHLELCARGFTGSVRMVQRAVRGWREVPGRPGRQARVAPTASGQSRAQPRPLSARQATWLLLRPLEDLTVTEQTMRTRLVDGAPTIGLALHPIAAFRQMVCTRDRAALDPWLEAAEASAVPEIRTFAASLRRDYEAIAAALEFPWSSGQVEGQVTKIKLRKREMYGRGAFDLLRRRVLLAS